jgi:hypothetical protein
MSRRFILYILTHLGLGITLADPPKEPNTPIQIRAILHDPSQPNSEFYLTDKTGKLVPLELRPRELSRPFTTLLNDGLLALYTTPTTEPKDPTKSLAASVSLPTDLKQAIVLITRSPAASKAPYQLIVMEESAKAFPAGESRVVSRVGVEVALQAGEHKLPIPPGKVTHVPPVREVDDFRMAQTNFYYQQNKAWVPITERKLQYLDAYRRIFIIHLTPGALQPSVTTVVDTLPIARPK